MTTNKTHNSSSVSTIVTIVMVCLLFLGLTQVLYAQSWKEPSTRNPSLDVNASDVPNLIRVENKRCVTAAGTGSLDYCTTIGAACVAAGETCQIQPQAIEGKLRVGSATSSDISSQFEVFGDFSIQDSLLIDSVFNTTNACTKADCTTVNGTPAPALLVQETAKAVGINTVDFTGAFTGKLNVKGNVDYPNGAVYATSSNSHAVYGEATATANHAGVYGVTSQSGGVAVFGKAIDVQHRGVWGVKGSGAFAALFKGNVNVVGGFIHADGTETYKVGSIADLGTDIPTTGEVGLSAWAYKDVAIATPTPAPIDFNFPTGEGYIIRQLQVLVKRSGQTTYQPIQQVANLSAQITGNQLTFSNQTGVAYTANVFMQVQTGVSVFVYHLDGAIEKEISTSKAVLYDPSAYFQIGARVAGASSQNFTWTISADSSGRLCQDANDTLCTTASNLEITTVDPDHDVYFNSSAFGTGQATITVSWGQGGSSASKTFVLKLADIQPPAAFNDVAVEVNATKTINMQVQVAGGMNPDILFSVPAGSTGEIVGNPIGSSFSYHETTGSLNAPKQMIKAELNEDKSVYKNFPVYIVPVLTPHAKFPVGGPQGGQETSTVAQSGGTSYPLDMSADLTASANPSTIACTGCTSWDQAARTGSFSSDTLGAHELTFSWTGSHLDYAGNIYSKTHTLYVGNVSIGHWDNSTECYVSLNLVGYPDGFAETVISSTNGNDATFSLPIPTYSNVIGSTHATPTNYITQIQNNQYRTFGRYNSPATGTAYTVDLKGRTTYDLRGVASVTHHVPAAACSCLNLASIPACCLQSQSTPSQGGGAL